MLNRSIKYKKSSITLHALIVTIADVANMMECSLKLETHIDNIFDIDHFLKTPTFQARLWDEVEKKEAWNNVENVNIIKFCSSVKWERDGSPVEWDSNIDGALKVARVEPTHAGAYTCAVMGPHGEIARRELQLVVSSK